MFKNFLTLLLVGLLFNTTAVSFVYADTKSDKEARFAEKVKKGIAKLGTGESALVEVKLRDNTKVRGYIKVLHGTKRDNTKIISILVFQRYLLVNIF